MRPLSIEGNSQRIFFENKFMLSIIIGLILYSFEKFIIRPLSASQAGNIGLASVLP